MMRYNIVPVAKPRMTGSDRWNKRPAVMKYWAFKDECKRLKVTFPISGACITFGIPMPKSWSLLHKQAMVGGPHRQRPDLDNLLKGLADAVYEDDSVIDSCCIAKVWAIEGYIEIT
jgi:Holliday junction resolvase RusA-like endonuclease